MSGERGSLRIHDAYRLVQDGRKLAALRSTIKLLADQCPYCGYGPIEQIDHLLQRGAFKLFSIFPLNLVPSCGACNVGKRKNPSANQAEHQLHVYLEDVSEYEFLTVVAEIDPATGALVTTYEIRQVHGLTSDVRARLINHLAEFDLHNRYKKQVNIFLSEQEFSLTSIFAADGADGLRNWLLGSARALAKRFGVNDWRAALMRGLANCDAFCEGGFQAALGIVAHNAAHQQAASATS